MFNEELTRIRRRLLEGGDADLSPQALREILEPLLRAQVRRRLRPVLNATGVMIHTNLGRIPALAGDALSAVQEAAGGYNNRSGGQRNAHVEGALCALTGAEAAIAVNN